MKTNNKIYTILSIFALVSLLLAVFFIYPLLKGIEKNSDDLVSAKNNMVALDSQISETEKFQKNYESYKPDLEKIDQLFVDQNNPVSFFEFLEKTADSSKITSQISLQSSSKNSQPFILFQFSSKGNFSDMLDFIKKIENGPYLIEIESLTIQNSQDKAEATFSIKVFTKQ